MQKSTTITRHGSKLYSKALPKQYIYNIKRSAYNDWYTSIWWISSVMAASAGPVRLWSPVGHARRQSAIRRRCGQVNHSVRLFRCVQSAYSSVTVRWRCLSFVDGYSKQTVSMRYAERIPWRYNKSNVKEIPKYITVPKRYRNSEFTNCFTATSVSPVCRMMSGVDWHIIPQRTPRCWSTVRLWLSGQGEHWNDQPTGNPLLLLFISLFITPNKAIEYYTVNVQFMVCHCDKTVSYTLSMSSIATDAVLL